MKFAKCFKCGKTKLASINRKVDNLTVIDVEMVQMGYGRNKGQHRCKDCNTDSDYRTEYD